MTRARCSARTQRSGCIPGSAVPQNVSPCSVKAAARFWERVDVGSLDNCWPFVGARYGGRDGKTYGAACSGHSRTVYAHRLAFSLANGIDIYTIPRSLVVRHACDNPICCNPMHLELGTQKQNAEDMAARGRSTRGSRSSSAVLNEAKVLRIKARLAAGEFHHLIARDFGVSRPAISIIASGKTWRHV